MEHCLFCLGVTPCSQELERKPPLKYKRTISLVSTDKMVGGRDSTHTLLDICAHRDDVLDCVVKDIGYKSLQAIDTRYYQICCKRFHAIAAPRSGSSASHYTNDGEEALNDTFDVKTERCGHRLTWR